MAVRVRCDVALGKTGTACPEWQSSILVRRVIVSTTNKRTSLYDLQLTSGGKMIDFHGWDMAVHFSSIMDEHRLVRDASGCFDLGHMGRLRVQGPGATAFLEHRITRPIASMAIGQVRYGLVCAADGTVEDDVLVSKEGGAAFHVVVNASNKNKILSLWNTTSDDTTIEDLSSQEAMIAVQGPRSPDVLATLGLSTVGLKYYHFHDTAWSGTPIRISRTGYTGENGFECFLASDQAAHFWTAAVNAGATPCGLGCRDTLRLEAGMPLYGNELDRSHTPIEAGLGFAVGKNKDFIGSSVLSAQRESGTEQVLVGLRMEGKRAARSGYAVLKNGEHIGVVTSGSLSPTFGASHCFGLCATRIC